MTSTNDNKDVKNTIEDDAVKGKPQIVDFNKSLEKESETLKSLDNINDLAFPARAKVLSAAWRAASEPLGSPNILRSLYRFTLILLLQDQWPRSDDAIKSDVIKAVESCMEAVERVDAEDVNVNKFNYLLETAKDPWHHPVLLQIMRGDQPQTQDVVEWVRKEGCAGALERLRQLCSMGGAAGAGAAVRMSRALFLPSMPTNIRCSALDSLLVLLRKQGKTTDCINEIKALDTKEALAVIGRLATRDRSSGRLWKYAHDTSLLCAQVLVAACVVRPLEEEGSELAALSAQLTSLYASCPNDLPPSLRKLLQPAETATHIFIVCQAVQHQFGRDMLPLICELYIRVLTKGLNELEQVKLEKDEALTLRSLQLVASWFLSLAQYLSFSSGVSAECILTAFSIHPSKEHYKRVQDCWKAMEKENTVPVKKDDFSNYIEDDLQKIFSTDANNRTAEEKLSNAITELSTLGLNKAPEGESGSDCNENEGDSGLISKAVLDSLLEGDCLGIDADLCKDLLVLLSGPRLRMLTWDSPSWEVLSGHCLFYMADTDDGTRTVQKELKYLHLDYSTYEYKEPDEIDVYHGIEKGYEHHLELDEDDLEEIEYEDAMRKKRELEKKSLLSDGSNENDKQKGANKKTKKKLIKKKQPIEGQPELPESKSIKIKHDRGKCPKKQHIISKDGFDIKCKLQFKKSNSSSAISDSLLKPIMKIKNNTITDPSQWTRVSLNNSEGMLGNFVKTPVPRFVGPSKPPIISIQSSVNNQSRPFYQKPIQKPSSQPSFFRLQMEKFEALRKKEIEAELARSNATFKSQLNEVSEKSDSQAVASSSVQKNINASKNDPTIAKRSSLLSFRKQKSVLHPITVSTTQATLSPMNVSVESRLCGWNFPVIPSVASSSITSDHSVHDGRLIQQQNISVNQNPPVSEFSYKKDMIQQSPRLDSNTVKNGCETKIKNFWQYLDGDKPIDFKNLRHTASIAHSNTLASNLQHNNSYPDFDSEALIKATVIENPTARITKPLKKPLQKTPKANTVHLQTTNIKVRNPSGLDVSPEKLLSFRNLSRKQNITTESTPPSINSKIKNSVQIPILNPGNLHKFQNDKSGDRIMNEDVGFHPLINRPVAKHLNQFQVPSELNSVKSQQKVIKVTSYEQFLADLQFTVNAGQESIDNTEVTSSDMSRLQDVKETILKKIECKQTVVKIQESVKPVVNSISQSSNQIDKPRQNAIQTYDPHIGPIVVHNRQLMNAESLLLSQSGVEKNDVNLAYQSDKRQNTLFSKEGINIGIHSPSSNDTSKLQSALHTDETPHNLQFESNMLHNFAKYDVKNTSPEYKSDVGNFGLESKKDIKKKESIPQTYARKNYSNLMKKQSAAKTPPLADPPREQVNCEDNKVPLRISSPNAISAKSNIVFKAADDLHKLLAENNESRPRVSVRQPKAKSKDRNDLSTTINKLTESCGLVVKLKTAPNEEKGKDRQMSTSRLLNSDKERLNDVIKRTSSMPKMQRTSPKNISDCSSHITIKNYSDFKGTDTTVDFKNNRVDKFVPKSPIKIMNNIRGTPSIAQSDSNESLRIVKQSDVPQIVNLPKVNILSHVRLPSFNSILKKNTDDGTDEHNYDNVQNLNRFLTDQLLQSPAKHISFDPKDIVSDIATQKIQQSCETSHNSINQSSSNILDELSVNSVNFNAPESCNQSTLHTHDEKIPRKNIGKSMCDAGSSKLSNRESAVEESFAETSHKIGVKSTFTGSKNDSMLNENNLIEHCAETKCEGKSFGNKMGHIFSVLITSEAAKMAVSQISMETDIDSRSQIHLEKEEDCNELKVLQNKQFIRQDYETAPNSISVDHTAAIAPVIYYKDKENLNEDILPQNLIAIDKSGRKEIEETEKDIENEITLNGLDCNSQPNGYDKSKTVLNYSAAVVPLSPLDIGRNVSPINTITEVNDNPISENYHVDTVPELNAYCLKTQISKGSEEQRPDYKMVVSENKNWSISTHDCNVKKSPAIELCGSAVIEPIALEIQPNIAITRIEKNSRSIGDTEDWSDNIIKGAEALELNTKISSVESNIKDLKNSKGHNMDDIVFKLSTTAVAVMNDVEEGLKDSASEIVQSITSAVSMESTKENIETTDDTKTTKIKFNCSDAVQSPSTDIFQESTKYVITQPHVKQIGLLTEDSVDIIKCSSTKKISIALVDGTKDTARRSINNDSQPHNTIASVIPKDSKTPPIPTTINDIHPDEVPQIWIEVPPLAFPVCHVADMKEENINYELKSNSHRHLDFSNFDDDDVFVVESDSSPEKNRMPVISSSKKFLSKENVVSKTVMSTTNNLAYKILNNSQTPANRFNVNNKINPKGNHMRSQFFNRNCGENKMIRPPRILDTVNLISDDDDSGSDVEIVSFDPLSATGDVLLPNSREINKSFNINDGKLTKSLGVQKLPQSNKRLSSINHQLSYKKRIKQAISEPTILTVADGFLKDVKVSQIPLADKIKLQMSCKVNVQKITKRSLPEYLKINQSFISDLLAKIDCVKIHHCSRKRISESNLKTKKTSKNISVTKTNHFIHSSKRNTVNKKKLFTRRTRAQTTADAESKSRVLGILTLNSDHEHSKIEIENDYDSQKNVDLNYNNTKVTTEKILEKSQISKHKAGRKPFIINEKKSPRDDKQLFEKELVIKDEIFELSIDDPEICKKDVEENPDARKTNFLSTDLETLKQEISSVKDEALEVNINDSESINLNETTGRNSVFEVSKSEDQCQNGEVDKFYVATLEKYSDNFSQKTMCVTEDTSGKLDVIPETDFNEEVDINEQHSDCIVPTSIDVSNVGEMSSVKICSNISWNNFESSLKRSDESLQSPCPDILSSTSDEEFFVPIQPDVIPFGNRSTLKNDADNAFSIRAHENRRSKDSPHKQPAENENELTPILQRRWKPLFVSSIRRSVEESSDAGDSFALGSVKEMSVCGTVKTYQKTKQICRKRTKIFNSQLRSKKRLIKSVSKIDLPHSSSAIESTESRVTDIQIYDSALSLRQVLVGDGQDNFSDREEHSDSEPDADTTALQFDLQDFLCDPGAPGDPSGRNPRNSFYSPIFSEPLLDEDADFRQVENEEKNSANEDFLPTSEGESPEGFVKGSDRGEVALSGAPQQRPSYTRMPTHMERSVQLQVDLENFLNGATAARRTARETLPCGRVLSLLSNDNRPWEQFSNRSERCRSRTKSSGISGKDRKKPKLDNSLDLISKESRKILSRIPGICDLEHFRPTRMTTVVQVVQLGQPPVVGGAHQSPLPGTPTRPPAGSGDYLTTTSNNTDYQSATNDVSRNNESDPKVNEAPENSITQRESIQIDNDDVPEQRTEDNSIIDISRNEEEAKCNVNAVTVSEPGTNALIMQPANNLGRVALDGQVQLVFATSQSVSQSSFVMATDSIADGSTNLNLTSSAGFVPVSRAQTLVNILSQKIIRPPVSGMQTQQVQMATFAKGAPISALSLQQALAQILPPPLSQPSTDGSATPLHPTGPQVVHIVQGKSTGQQSFGSLLVDSSQQSIMSASGATQVLHIVQGKNSSPGSSNILGQSQLTGTTFGGLSLVESGSQQSGNQVLHIVNAGASNKNNSAAAQLLKRVNLLTSITNSQGNNEQKMVQFVCKAADGKAIQVNAQHQRGMVLRLQPIDNSTQPVSKPPDSQPIQGTPLVRPASKKPSPQSEQSQQEIKSRSVYEENYAKFIQNSSNKLSPIGSEKSTSLPKFNQAFGKSVFQENNESLKTDDSAPESSPNHSDRHIVQDVAISVSSAQTSQVVGPPLLIRKTQPASTVQNLAQQMKHTMAPVNIQTMHGGVIYTRQIPVNIGGGQTINLITVPGAELIDEAQLQAIQKRAREKAANPGEPEQPAVKIIQDRQRAVVQTEPGTDETDRTFVEQTPNTVNAHQLLAQMRIKVPMLSKGGTQMVTGTRVVRPVLQIQRNVIPGTNPAVYQQLVLTAAPPLRPPAPVQPQPARPPRPATTPHQESNLSSSTLEQLREFDMVLEQVKERSTVQPGGNGNSFSDTSPQRQSNENSTLDPATAQPSPQREVVYSIGPNQTVNVTYVNQKVLTSVPSASTMYVQSPESTVAVNTPQQNSPSIQISHTVGNLNSINQQKAGPNGPTRVSSKPMKNKSGKPAAVVAGAASKTSPAAAKTSLQKPLEDEQTTQRILYILAEYKEQVENSPDKDKPAPRRRSNPPTNPSSSSKRKKGGSSKRGGSGQSLQEMSPPGGDDAGRTMGSEDSSCGLSQGECADNSIHAPESPQGSPRKAPGKLIFQQEADPNGITAGHTQRNVIIADGQTVAMTRPGAGKATAVLMPANYLLPVSMMKGGQQITIVTNQGPKVLSMPHGDGGAANALFLQRLISPAGLKPMLARPGQVRQVRLPANTVQAFNLTAAPNATQDGNWIGTGSLNNQQPKLLVEYAPNVTVGSDPNHDSVKSETSDVQSLKEENSSVGTDSCTATPGEDLNGKTDGGCVFVGGIDSETTRETKTNDQILHQIHVSKAPPNATLNLIQVHSLNSGEPGKIYSVQNQAGLSSLFQLASKTSLSQAFQTVNLQGLTRDGLKLSTDGLQECAQNLMLVRKHPQQVQHYETQYSSTSDDPGVTDNQDMGQMKPSSSPRSPPASSEGTYGQHSIQPEDSHHSIIKSTENGDADVPWSLSSNGGDIPVNHGGSSSPSYVGYGDSPSRMQHHDDQQDCDITEAEGVDQSNMAETSQVLHHSYSPGGSPPGPRHLYHKMFITDPAKKVYGSTGHIMTGGQSPSIEDDKQFSQHMKKESSAVSTVTLHTSNSASFTIHHHHQQHQREREGNGDNETEMEMESGCVDSREGADRSDVIRGGGVDGHSRSNIISGHHTAASLRHKYALLEHELRLQKSLSEECEDLGVDSPSASDLFPEAELLFAASPSSQFDQSQDGCVPPQHHHHVQQQPVASQSSSSIIAHHHNVHQSRHSPIMMMMSGRENHDRLSNCDHQLSEDSSRMLDEEHILDEGGEESDFARMHPNTTFHSGEIELVDDAQETALNMSYGGVSPTETVGSRPAQRPGRRNEAERSVIEGIGGGDRTTAITYPRLAEAPVRFGPLISDDNSADDSVNSQDSRDGVIGRESVVNRDLNLSSAEASGRRNATQVIRRAERYGPSRKEGSDDNDPSRNGGIFPPDGGSSQPGVVSDVLKSLMAERDGATCSSPERHSELFWESNSNSDRSEENRPTGLLDFSSEDSDKCCKSPASADDNSTDSGSLDSRPPDVMPVRINSVIKSSPGAADGPILHGALTGSVGGTVVSGRPPPLASRFDDSNASTSPEGDGRLMAWRRGSKAGRRVLSPRSLSAEINMGAEIETSSSEGVSVLTKPASSVVHSGSSTPEEGSLAASGPLGNAARRISLRGSGGVKRSCHCCGGPDVNLSSAPPPPLATGSPSAAAHKRARRRLPPPLH